MSSSHLTSGRRDSETDALARDERVSQAAQAAGCEVRCRVSHTLYDPRAVISANNGTPPLTYTAFQKVIGKLGAPPAPVADPPLSFPPPLADAEALAGFPHGIPSVAALGYPPFPADDAVQFLGGETEGLRRMEAQLARSEWVAAFAKPETDPTALIQSLATKAVPANPFEAAKKPAAAAPSPAAQLLTPSTTGLSPYLTFGCVSARTFAARLRAIERAAKTHTAPPVSLWGQMLWRDFYYCVAAGTPNYERMAGNAICRQIPWGHDAALLSAWECGRTGYPWIDAAMTQLRTQGWMHHLARHSVACFLTRGDLWQSWEAGAAIFERLLLDADPTLNAGNWMWLSASAFFHQYFRVYSPVAFPKKYDPAGNYVRHFIPALAKLPAKYIYEPWKAPMDVQRAAGCIIGTDYPAPIVLHEVASKANLDKMAKAYAAHKASGGGEDVGEEDGAPKKKAKRLGAEASRDPAD